MARSVVVDKNLLEHDSLGRFLASDPKNRAVVTDFARFESFAGRSAVNLTRSLRILSKFPRQVYVLKGSMMLAQLGPIDPNHRFDMVDWRQTENFPSFCDAIKRLEHGEESVARHIAEQTAAARQHLDMLLGSNDALVSLIVELGKSTGDDLLKARRAGAQMPREDTVRLLESMEYMASRFFHHVLKVQALPSDPRLASRCYLFRAAIAIRLLALKWAEHGGGVGDVKPEKLRNDFVDLTYAVAATYWDGFLTLDSKAFDIYTETEYLANEFFPDVRRI